MEVEIRVLSGPGQGSKKIFECETLLIGDSDDCDIQFDPEKIPAAAGQCVEIRLTDTGWKLANRGDGEIRVNQDIVEGLYQIKPGDVIRLSENGPDYSFGLVRPGMNVVEQTADSTLGEVLEETAANVSVKVSQTARRYPAMAAGVVLVLLLIVLGLFFTRSNAPQIPQRPPEVVLEIGPMESQRVAEGEEWEFDTPLRVANVDRSTVRFMLAGEFPQGMEIDASSGRLTWTPTENQGPGQYEVTITARSGTSKQSTAKVLIDVTEVNRPPLVEPIPLIVLTENDGFSLNYMVRALDPDDPTTVLRYMLSPKPDGMVIDTGTGEIRWKLTEDQLGRTFAAMVVVREENSGQLSASVPFLVRSSSPKKSHGIKDAVYLLSIKDPMGRQEYAICNAIAVGSNALVTSGSFAKVIQEKKDKGWIVNALQGVSGQSEPVLDILMHDVFNLLADDQESQVYVDVAIILVEDQRERVVIDIAGSTVLNALKPGDSLEFLAIDYEAGPLTQFKDTNPKSHKGRLHLFDMILLDPDDELGPTMLHIFADLPKNNYGGAVLNQQQQLLGLYAEQASVFEDLELPNSNDWLHYAPTLLLVKSWLQGEMTKYWKPAVNMSEEVGREP
jgi:hypothetical protein